MDLIILVHENFLANEYRKSVFLGYNFYVHKHYRIISRIIEK